MACWISFIPILLLLTDYVILDDCGRRSDLPGLLISHGRQSRLGEWPWHVAIVQRMDLAEENYACGGTIIATRYILTAAHCTYPPTRERCLKPSELLIRAGISNLQQQEVFSLQEMAVAEIINNEGYQTATGESDIALLNLERKLNFTDYVKPICLWKDRADEELIIDKLGYVAGWGRDENGKLPDQLKHAVMPIVSRKKCRESDSNYYTRYLFDRKSFCASFRNGTSPELGDSGGGLYIEIGSIWTVRGIISNGKFNRVTQKLDASSFIVFSDVAYFLSWINNTIMAKPENCGQRTELHVVPSVHHKSQSRLGEWPWHAAVMHWIDQESPIYSCGGTIVGSRYILTAAHCTYALNPKRRLKPLEILIRAGITNLQQPEPSLQEKDVVAIMIHEKYSNPENDIAVLKLDGQLILTDYVKPICLWRERAEEVLIVGKRGYIAGWSIDEHGELSADQKQENMSIVSRKMCKNRDPDFYTHFLFNMNIFCAGFRNRTSSLLLGFSGGGLYLEQNGRWTLRGINIYGKPNFINAQLRMNPSSYLLFTDVAQLLPWVIKKIGNEYDL